MAKIGIITFSQTLDNYGQVLQYIAIKEYLNARGHHVCLVRFRQHVNIVRKITRILKRILLRKKKIQSITTYDKWAICSAKYEKLHPRHFEEFRKKNCNIIELTLPCYERYFDAFVVGSDQIWSSIAPVNFLNFTKYGETKFAIAPSIGRLVVDEAQIPIIRELLRDFKFITCREQSAVDMCKKAGRTDALLVLDPTFLIPKEMYLKYINFAQKDEDYIFIYMLGADIPIDLSYIYEFARTENLNVKYVASQGREDSYPKEWATIPEWLTLLSNSKYVFTNSFHGMALSCVFNKQFLVFPIVGEMCGMNERIFNIAKVFNCEDHIFSGDLDSVKNTIDYSYINTKINSNRLLLNKLLDSIKY